MVAHVAFKKEKLVSMIPCYAGDRAKCTYANERTHAHALLVLRQHFQTVSKSGKTVGVASTVIICHNHRAYETLFKPCLKIKYIDSRCIYLVLM